MKYFAALVATVGLMSPGFAQNAPKGHELTLYSSTNLKGQKRVIVETTPNLDGANADNFAWSLSTKGQWEVCMDAGHRAGCRVVSGDIRDLGTDGGAITSVRYLGAPGQSIAASAPLSKPSTDSASHPPVVAGVRYSTTSGMMTISQWAPSGFLARYGDAGSRLEGTVSGNTVTGFWLQDSSNQACSTTKSGTRHWGRFTFSFAPDGSKFDGQWDWCGTIPGDSQWNGTREGGDTYGAAGTTPAGLASGAHTPGAIQRVGDRAGSAVERRVGDEVERQVGNAIGSLLGRD